MSCRFVVLAQVPDSLIDAFDAVSKLTARPSYATQRLVDILHKYRTEIGIRNVATEVHVSSTLVLAINCPIIALCLCVYDTS